MIFNKYIKSATYVATFLAASGGVFGYAHNTFASKADVTSIKEQFLYSERRNLSRDKYQYEIKLEKGQKLSDTERRHYKELEDEIKRIDMELKYIQRQKK